MISPNEIRKLKAFARKRHIKTLAIFGSRARGDENKTSDLDLLVTFAKPVGLLEIIGIQRDLSEFMGMRVDLVSRKALHPRIRERIFREMKVVL